ncbi:M15 family metallopeptidase [Halanaerobacter jeridensis]|uniref:LAS superfamily LD-carboxypeptidase LdcB n=1 Tax=Halanaerobacter jeridensis TaxID=706427 RepID=A0A938XPG9_9FIRM|nr:M15 family metallopeptidase [Halanaerobacter jeridensis]MBM7556572.1 LAS superfamily LD-carboxypeptidase LdcB [Halanaerobacter jeridensis]
MVSIIGHHLINKEEGYQILLYLDPQLIEVADEFDESFQNKEDLRQVVNSYVKNRLPDLKVTVIRVVLGSLVIASIPLLPGTEIKDLDSSQELNLKTEVKEVFENTPQEIEKDLLLVNKNNSLADNYTPLNLIVPEVPFIFKGFHEKKLMAAKAATALEELFAAAKANNIELYAVSGYRSYQRQEVIFKSQVEKHGLLQANQISARPGESEHQTGLAMDVTSPQVKFKLVQEFGVTKEGQWLKEHAAGFGFIIRYPEGKDAVTGYQYEPWHIRYVGQEIAQKIASQDLTLEEYLA